MAGFLLFFDGEDSKTYNIEKKKQVPLIFILPLGGWSPAVLVE